MDVLRNPLGRSAADLKVARRRKAQLEVVTAAVSMFCGVFFGSVFVAEHSWVASLLAGAICTVAAGVGVALIRRNRPAHIAEPQILRLTKDRDHDDAIAQNDDERAGWDLSNIISAAVLLPPLVILGLMTVCWLPVLIIIGFAVATGNDSASSITIALACTFLTVGVLEYAVVKPLASRWNLPEFD